ncbi:GAF domain-containing protein [Hymenobacter sp. ASUV-10]|uniref:GAF domain-containing protein n=1 Tax=Hymenobacter aranciens TaxID=3063996 RepID=A0ABT9BEE3_9BACT|nr:GAF domain-containing protein [Hymenobacter sp. ASUV-10]MDO7876602.1 GAF domain-containing protein [Hymenobacter sp. ASUV-10]
MDPALLPANDTERLHTLAKFQLLDARSERILDEVVTIAARLFRVSNAMLSIIEENTVLLKAPYNLPMRIERIPRHQSLCAATILEEGPVVFEDLQVKSSPLIDTSLIAELGLHFYAGQNLRSMEGHNLGSLCILDGPPRQFSPAERTLLTHLGGVVMALLELRRVLGLTADSSFKLWQPIYDIIGTLLRRLENVADLAATLDAPGPYSLPDHLARDASGLAHIVEIHVRAAVARV